MRKASVVKPMKRTGESHVSNTKMGMGDYYGTGVKAKIGTLIQGSGMNPLPPNKLKKPPKSVA